MVYQIQREINMVVQCNLSITQYFSKLKRLWDEFTYLESIPIYTCGAVETMSDLLESHNVIQFLMGLNEEYTHSKDHILLMDPLLSINKVYSMVLKVEKQRVAQQINSENVEMSALLANSHFFNNNKVGNNGKSVSHFKSINNATYGFKGSFARKEPFRKMRKVLKIEDINIVSIVGL